MHISVLEYGSVTTRRTGKPIRETGDVQYSQLSNKRTGMIIFTDFLGLIASLL